MRTPSLRAATVTLVLALLAIAALAIAQRSSPSDDSDFLEGASGPAVDGRAAEQSMLDAPSADSVAESQASGIDGSVADQPDLVLRAAQEVVVADVAATSRRVIAEVTAVGGFVSSEHTSASTCFDGVIDDPCGQGGHSTITYRAPATAVGQLMDFAAEQGKEDWRTRSAEDVGAQIADVDARVASARASLDRLNALMARAETLTDIIALEGQLAARQAELESLLARQASLADQVALATVTLTLTADAQPAAADDGFLGGLQSGLQALGSAALAALTLIGWLLPFALILALVALPARWLWRRRKGSAATQRAETAEAQPVQAER